MTSVKVWCYCCRVAFLCHFSSSGGLQHELVARLVDLLAPWANHLQLFQASPEGLWLFFWSFDLGLSIGVVAHS